MTPGACCFPQRHQQALRRRPRAERRHVQRSRRWGSGLIGANGAGKSTVIGVLSGALMLDSGSLVVNGRNVPLGSVTGARHAGVAVISGTDALSRPHGRGEHRRHGNSDRQRWLRRHRRTASPRCATCSTASVWRSMSPGVSPICRCRSASSWKSAGRFLSSGSIFVLDEARLVALGRTAGLFAPVPRSGRRQHRLCLAPP